MIFWRLATSEVNETPVNVLHVGIFDELIEDRQAGRVYCEN